MGYRVELDKAHTIAAEYRMNYERAAEVLYYDPGTGELKWKESRGRVAKGSVAGSIRKRSDGKHYRYVRVDSRSYLSHRVAWLLMTGEWPIEVDHIDGDPTNNRWSNLRNVTRSENCHNFRKSRNQHGMGVFTRSSGRFWSSIYAEGKRHYLGTFDTAEEAHRAYIEAKKRYHRGYIGAL